MATTPSIDVAARGVGLGLVLAAIVGFDARKATR